MDSTQFIQYSGEALETGSSNEVTWQQEYTCPVCFRPQVCFGKITRGDKEVFARYCNHCGDNSFGHPTKKEQGASKKQEASC